MLSDGEGNYIDVKESALNLIGYSRDELIGHTSTDLNISNDKARYIIEL